MILKTSNHHWNTKAANNVEQSSSTIGNQSRTYRKTRTSNRKEASQKFEHMKAMMSRVALAWYGHACMDIVATAWQGNCWHDEDLILLTLFPSCRPPFPPINHPPPSPLSHPIVFSLLSQLPSPPPALSPLSPLPLPPPQGSRDARQSAFGPSCPTWAFVGLDFGRTCVFIFWRNSCSISCSGLMII